MEAVIKVREVLCVTAKGLDRELRAQLADAGWDVQVVASLKAAERAIQQQPARVGIIFFPEIDGGLCAELDRFLRQQRDLEWIGAFEADALMLPACRDLVIDHLFDHHTLPVDAQRLVITLGRAWGHALLRSNGHGPAATGDSPIVGKSAATMQLARRIKRIANVDAPVLVRGESGSGKELAARAIHAHSARAKGPFVAINCGAIQATLIQSELFGHAKGAFTGAAHDKRGLIESASGGTVFLDEIGDLSLELQVNLLRFLQERTVTRVGATRGVEVDVRVIAATHVNLEEAVAVGSFREDLFYRLNVLLLEVPPLRDRQEDVALLAQHYFGKHMAEKSVALKGFSQHALALMRAHPWPGNVRELINRVRRAMVMAEGRLISAADLGLEGEPAHAPEMLGEVRVEAERQAVSTGLHRVGFNVTAAARQLGVSRMTMYRLMAKHGIQQ